MTSPRPARTEAAGAAVRVLRGVALLITAALTGWVLVRYPSLPDTVPTHFGAQGNPDEHGSKVSVLVLAGVMIVLSALIAWLSTRPRLLNYPIAVTEQNAQRLYREGERLLVVILLGLQSIYLGIILSVTGGAGRPALVVGLVVTVIAVVTGIIRMVRVR
ncbi:DUF1648 domain-containing protein [Brachybacterium sp. GCM10030267]|uniref:DUF1648 domain-containing protein n=1 Tax=unclassified Brachybacterium TaxID=2623841 RepID=UPI0036229933